MNNKLVKLFALCGAFFLYNISEAGIKKELAKLKIERSEFLSEMKKAAGGDSTIAYRVLSKKYDPQLKQLNRSIEVLEAWKKQKELISKL